jgi:hypothetical protein
MSLPAVRSRGAKLVYVVCLLVQFDVIGLALSKLRAKRAGPPDGWTGATGGLGLGGATGPAWSLFGVDPRLESACEAELFPIPGLACPDPTHGAGIAAFPPRR